MEVKACQRCGRRVLYLETIRRITFGAMPPPVQKDGLCPFCWVETHPGESIPQLPGWEYALQSGTLRTADLGGNDLIHIAAGGVSVHFWREADRFQHQIAVETSGERPLWLSSIEGEANDVWPPSPPLQELHLEDRPGGKQVALLVGRAGRAHWSLSVEADGAHETLLFDVACRSLCDAERLHSSYRFSEGCELEAERVLFSRHELRLLQGEMRFVDADHLLIGPRRDEANAGKVRTFRWRYRIGSANACPPKVET